MKKDTPVTPVDGYLSVVCSSGRHTGCRAEDWVCACNCHRIKQDDATVAPSESVEDVAADVNGAPPASATHTDRSPDSDGGAVDVDAAEGLSGKWGSSKRSARPPQLVRT